MHLMVFHAPLGILLATQKGDSEGNVSRLQCRFNGDKSTVLRGEPYVSL